VRHFGKATPACSCATGSASCSTTPALRIYIPSVTRAYAHWRLALVTLLQFRKGLSDRQAAEAVRARIDWKYLLGLDRADPGFDHSVLCEFRARLLDRGGAERLLARVLDIAREEGLLKARGRQRTDSTHVLAAVRDLNRIELLAETLRAALNALAVATPDWLRADRRVLAGGAGHAGWTLPGGLGRRYVGTVRPCNAGPAALRSAPTASGMGQGRTHFA